MPDNVTKFPNGIDVTQDLFKIGGTAVTTTAAELNAIAGGGLSAAELGVLDGVTAGTQAAAKAVVADANVNTGISKVTQLHIGVSGSETQVTSTAAELNALDASVAAVLAESAGTILRTAVATYDFAVDGGAISTIAIGDALPDNAIVLGGFVEVQTTLTSVTDAATVALSIVGAGDIKVAIAISDGSNPWDAGTKAIVPKFNTPESTSVKLTAANQVDVAIAVEAVTAGKFHVTLFYVMGHA